MYVAIEGVDTCGKSTQIDLLRAHYKTAIFTKEPGAGSFGARVRELIMAQDLCGAAEMFLFLADRAQHVESVIKPHAGELIISDRSLLSGIAYARGLDLEKLCWLNLHAVQGILPQKVIFLHLDAQNLAARLALKNPDKIEKRGVDYLLEIQEKIGAAAKALGIKTLQIDAGLDRGLIFEKIKGFIDE